jgi:hypothetical protein
MLEVEGRYEDRRWWVMIVSDTRDTGRALRRRDSTWTRREFRRSTNTIGSSFGTG